MHKRVKIIVILLVILILKDTNSAFCQSLNYNELIKKTEYFKNRNSDSVIYYARHAYLGTNNQLDLNQKVSALFILVRTYQKSGELLQALSYCDTAKLFIDQHGLINRKSEALMCTGLVYQGMGLMSEALDLFFKALKDMGSIHSMEEMTDLYYYISTTYYNLNEIEKAQKYSRLGIAVAKKNNSDKDLFQPYLILANSFTSLDSIQKYLSLTEDLLSKYPNLLYERVVLLNNQALINKAIGKLTISKSKYLEAITISKNSGFPDYLSTLYNNYAYQLMAEKNFDSARIVLGKALTLANNIHNIDLQATVYDSYSDYFSAIGNYKTAFAYQDSAIERQNEYRDQQRIQESLFLSAVFETEQKDNELLAKESQISRLWVFILSTLAFLVAAIGLGFYFRQKLLLSKSNMEIMKKGKALELADALIHGQDAERKRLAMELHDGLGARLGALRFLVDGFFSDHIKYHEVNNSIVTISQNVRDISHRMLPAHLEEQGLVLTIQNMASAINKSGKFEVVFESNLVHRLSEKLELNIYYLIYELINNAIKHSGGNTVFVQLIELDDCINLSVEDNGGGFNSQKKSEGLGLKNIKTRIEYLGGKFEINADDIVTLFLIEIPAKKS